MFPADQVRPTSQSSARRSSVIDVFVVHHQASTNDDATIGMMVSGSRQVSATWTVDNSLPVGGGLRGHARITSVVPEARRPWTSASEVDDRAVTVECANSSGAPYWGIDPLSFEAVARLIAYSNVALDVPLKRSTPGDKAGVVGHRDVAGIFGGSYATACPGSLDVDALIARAAQIVAGSGNIGGGLSPTPTPPPITEAEDDEMLILQAPEGLAIISGSVFYPLADGQTAMNLNAQGVKIVPIPSLDFVRMQRDLGPASDATGLLVYGKQAIYRLSGGKTTHLATIGDAEQFIALGDPQVHLSDATIDAMLAV